jgi:hypothetical protein
VITFPKAALFDSGYLKRQCAEPIFYQCPEDGGDVERDDQNQLVCTICYRAVLPILRCVRCKEELVLGSNEIESMEERTCLSGQAYDKGNGNALPAFAPADETLWAFRTSALASTQVATETALRNMFTKGELTETAEVLSPQHDTFKLAQGSSEFGTALSAGLILIAEHAERERLEKQRAKQFESELALEKNKSVDSSDSLEFKTSDVVDAIRADKRVNPIKSKSYTFQYVLLTLILLGFVLFHFRFELTTLIKISSPPSSVQSKSQADTVVVIKYDDGSVFSGKAKDGKPNGQGTMTYASGNLYEGGFIDGLKDGQGTFIWKNGEIYVGEYKNDVRNGHGTYTWPNGGRYVGEWKDGKHNGRGAYTWANGDRYVGEWKDGKMNGQGAFTSKDGTKTFGQYKNGMLMPAWSNR